MCSHPEKTSARIAALAPSKSGEVTYERTSRAAARRRHALRVGHRAAQHEPAAARAAQQRRHAPAAGARPSRRMSPPGRGPSGRVQSPAVQSPATDSARPALASSSATQPPSELPATCAPPQAELVEQAATRAGEHLRRGLRRRCAAAASAPKPGRSTAITSRSRARRSITGSQTTSSAPSGWISTSGSPLPAADVVQLARLQSAARTGRPGTGRAGAAVGRLGEQRSARRRSGAP